MQKLKKNRFGTKLIGKCFSYRLNAVIDSYISRGILQKLHNKPLDNYPDEVLLRIKEFEEISKKTKNPRAFMLGVSFTQYFANGYWNVLYPVFIEKRFKRVFTFKTKKILYSYFKSISVEPFGLGIFNVYWRKYVKIVNESFRNLKKSIYTAEKHLLKVHKLNYHVPKLKGRKEFLLAVVITNKLNKKHNANVASMRLMEETKEKILLFKKISKQFSHQKKFMKSALKTQTAAGWWDKQFIRAFKIRYRNVFRRKDVRKFIKQYR